MPTLRPVIVAVLGIVGFTLAGCNAWEDRAEFAPPQSRWPADQPSSRLANAPPPPIPAQYCYRTLATVDCFAQAQPERISGYTGVYPNPASLPPPPVARN